ncbi:MAG: hypothetical protein IJ856_06315 [Candidatus Methanomethylophilaceae archaeon]|nr:hypothetical protein [Candidatus Methanomethylophilaceae archaeon]
MPADGIPPEIEESGVSDWFGSLNDINRTKVKRYLSGIDTTSPVDFIQDLMSRSSEDHNYKLTVLAGDHALSLDITPMMQFNVREALIEGLYGSEDYDRAIEECCANLDLFPEVKEEFMAQNGGKLPDHIMCRNRLIDILVGVQFQYDKAMELLDEFVSIGILDEEELAYRKQSLKIHRMQRTFDNIYSYRPKSE